ncbi:hypothetical protein DIS24_g8079 [Lasiodiplodia hormozganensis]|uniref:Caib baif family enzyme n=1 Tax=Lasiodiplodia hormozganensis TaxID=869390 RepID=A0AA39Y649_9PEZI|nr:hypothetical protein DIS24_g8079 [Lasiodiplodia hormozganensis]
MSDGNSHHNGPSPLCHIVTPVGMLGFGFDELQTADMLAKLVATNIPTAIILDSGSTDSGPSKLALGSMSCPREAYTRDLTKLLGLVDTFHVPLIFSSAGGDGSDDHVKEILQVIEEIAEQEKNEHCRFKTVAIFSGIEKTLVRDRLRAGAITGCGPCVPPLTEEDIDSARTIVGQMGPEPFIDAMTAHPDFDVIVGGRAYDPAPYIAYASFLSIGLKDGVNSAPVEALLGGFSHMGKIMECGGICAEPKSHGAVASVYQDGTFDITPLSLEARCTPVSVAAHTLYEKSRPDLLHGPGGYLDVTSATYEQLGDGRTVRLEGATTIGYRSMFMGSVRDPILIDQLDTLLERVKAYVAAQHRDHSGCWELEFHVYGRQVPPSSEIFLIGEALASSQQLATSLACTARIATTLGHLASVLRSKNAGPYEITFDIMFDSESVYNLIRKSGLLSPKTAADALKVPQDDIIWCGFFNPARAFKVTIPRVRAGKKVAAGSFMEDDAHGSQQHVGLVNLELSTTILEGLGKLEVV